MPETNRKKKLIILLVLVLVVGFAATSLLSYFLSLSSLRNEITSSTLPLTSDNIYSEIQRDLIRPVFISSLMANDTFLRDWILGGEKDVEEVTKYLKEIKVKYNTETSFFVSEATRNYYYADGILKKVDPDEERDIWYFRLRKMVPDYEINVDSDMANRDTMTIFINHKVYDYEGRYIGATGVGLKVSSLIELMDHYSRKYNRNIYFADKAGDIMLLSTRTSESARNIRDIVGISSVADEILATESDTYTYRRHSRHAYLNTRFISELNWYLLVEHTGEGSTENIHKALVINLLLFAVITTIVIVIVIVTINAYQRIGQRQKAELLDKNEKIEEVMTEVKQLSGLLPICSSCKKIRDDKGYWQQIELYIRDHSDADFSHGLCPDCAKKLYGELADETGGDAGKSGRDDG
jgi:flagellar basal body-associated protein FliL